MKNYTIIFTLANPMHKPLLPLGSEAAPTHSPHAFSGCAVWLLGAAAQPSGSKLPRHKGLGNMGKLYWAGTSQVPARLNGPFNHSGEQRIASQAQLSFVATWPLFRTWSSLFGDCRGLSTSPGICRYLPWGGYWLPSSNEPMTLSWSTLWLGSLCRIIFTGYLNCEARRCLK